EVLPDEPARVAEPGTARIREEAEACGLDRARGEHEGGGGRGLVVPLAVDVLDAGDHTPAGREPDRGGVVAELAVAGEKGPSERGHGGRALAVVRAAEAAAVAAVDARRPSVVRLRVDRLGVGVRVERRAEEGGL